eukprot:CAMPEP_0201604400 /NCGR_PEP_ID=MMETSP0492-20130828/4557_1 /ASSEMBLY_ACC=CAM_ASM_000837 /TAXON_ID=420259 /ORGANISM="Thalassiosira gravida, Strain GMp14c1" /LENGTH=237 /DNA_ID=CAMNT_0048068423 /DNA_START=424 /DNA_END=1137 /DNA_ORIENTATION=+
MTKPAPKVESIRASVVKPQTAGLSPKVESPKASYAVPTAAPAVEPAFADPPTDHGSSLITKSAVNKSNVADVMGVQSQKQTGLEAFRATHHVSFEGPAAVVVGPVEKDICQRCNPCFDERAFISFGEAKRHILVVDSNMFVFLDIMGHSPLYTLALSDLVPEKEDPNNPDFYSHTISPEANTGFRTMAVAAQSKESLESVLLKNGKGKIAYQVVFDKSVDGDDVVDRFLAAIVPSET